MKGMRCAALTLVVLLGATEHVQATTTTEAPAEKTTEAPAEKTTEAPAEKTTEAPAEATTEAPADKTTEAPAEATTQAPIEATTQAPTPPPFQPPPEITTIMPTTTTNWMHSIPHSKDWWKYMLGVGAGMIGAIGVTASAIAISHAKPVQALSSPQRITGLHAQVAAKTGHFINNAHGGSNLLPPLPGQLPGGQGYSTDGLHYRSTVGHPLVPLYDHPESAYVAYPQAHMRGGSIHGYQQGEGYSRKFAEKPELEITDSYEAGKAFGQKYFGTIVFTLAAFFLVLFIAARVRKARKSARHSHYHDVTPLTQDQDLESDMTIE